MPCDETSEMVFFKGDEEVLKLHSGEDAGVLLHERCVAKSQVRNASGEMQADRDAGYLHANHRVEQSVAYDVVT